jgi:hypothetical protein
MAQGQRPRVENLENFKEGYSLKSRKLFAILTLLAFMMTLLPMAAFAAGTSAALGSSLLDISTDADADGVDELEFDVYLRDKNNNSTTYLVYGSANAYLYIWAERYTETVSDVDTVAKVEIGGVAKTVADYAVTNMGDKAIIAIPGSAIDSSDIAVYFTSKKAGAVTVKAAIVDGVNFNPSSISAADVVEKIVKVNQVQIGQKSSEFKATSTSNWTVTFANKNVPASLKADGVTKAEYYVYVKDSVGNPVVGEKVTLSVNKSGASLDTYEETTDAVGKISFGITATRNDTFTITAEVGSKVETKSVTFAAADAFDIVVSSVPDGPVAVDWDPGLEFKLYDIHGNIITDVSGIISTLNGNSNRYHTVVTKPSGSNVDDKYLRFAADGETLKLVMDKAPDKVGTYKIKASLPNGKYVEVTFEAKEQGKIVKMGLTIDEERIAWNKSTKTPTVKLYDAAGVYKKESSSRFGSYTWTVDNAALATVSSTGIVTAKDGSAHNYKTGTVVVSVIDTTRNLVATDTVVIGSDVSSAKVVANTGAVVGQKANVEIQVIDADGNPIALDATDNNRSAINVEVYEVSKPAGAIVDWSLPITSDYQKSLSRTGKLAFGVTSDKPGDVTLQLIITQDLEGTNNDVTLSVPVTVKFAAEKPTYGAKEVTMFIGAKGYIQDGVAKVTDVAPFIKDGRTFVAVRPVAEAFGAEIGWNEATQTVTLTRADISVTIVIGSNTIKVVKDGVTSTVTADVAAFIKDGRTVLPLRACGDAFGATTVWDEATQSVKYVQ